MSKNNTQLLKFLLMILLVIIAAVGSFFAVKSKADTNKAQISEMKQDGCDPSRELKTDVAVIKVEMQGIRKEQTIIREVQGRQDEKLDKILERLPR